jgi:hypothetical protein
MVVADDTVALADLSDLGFITPIATPARLRAAFAEKQRLYAAILDESDYRRAASPSWRRHWASSRGAR